MMNTFRLPNELQVKGNAITLTGARFGYVY